MGVIWITIVIVSFYYAYDYSIANINFSPSQPIAFSHKTHISKMQMKCTFCHYDAITKDIVNIPSTHSCMTCHLAFRNEVDAMKPLNLSYDNDSVIVWNRITKLPDYVHFSHKNHINKQIDCSSCHGKVEELDSNKLTIQYTMKWCLDCHRKPELKSIPPREISGIWAISNNKLNFQSGKDLTKPYFGSRHNSRRENEEEFIIMPSDPGFGPENCSSCHY